jgi:hypothetical protein
MKDWQMHYMDFVKIFTVHAGIGRKILDWSLWGKCRNDFQAGVQLSAQRLFTDGCIQVTQIMPEEIA